MPRCFGDRRLRNRTWLILAFIVVLAVVSSWISFPGSALDIEGFRAGHPIHEGLDLQGGLQVVLQARPVAGQTIDKNTLEGTRRTLERRVNGLGVSEPLIQTRGNDQIIVELPVLTIPKKRLGSCSRPRCWRSSTRWDSTYRLEPWSTRRSDRRRTTWRWDSRACRNPGRCNPIVATAPQLQSPQPLSPALTRRRARSTRPSSAVLSSRMPTSRLATRDGPGGCF